MKSCRSEKGTAVVEFAVLFLLLLVFLFGIIDFGIIWVESHYITNAAREGARVASKFSDLSETTAHDKIEAAVKKYLEGLYGTLLDSKVHLTYDAGFPSSPNFVEIVVQDGTLNDFTDPDIASPPNAVKVQVRVQTAQVWEPVLWDLLQFIPGTDVPAPREITRSAVFAKDPD
jgi:Flp pilus assembly protein TadG